MNEKRIESEEARRQTHKMRQKSAMENVMAGDIIRMSFVFAIFYFQQFFFLPFPLFGSSFVYNVIHDFEFHVMDIVRRM